MRTRRIRAWLLDQLLQVRSQEHPGDLILPIPPDVVVLADQAGLLGVQPALDGLAVGRHLVALPRCHILVLPLCLCL